MDFKIINIKPCDNTFFGDGNQFNFDISEVIKSKNTPYPSVFFGAIFTAILTENDDFRKDFFQKGKYDHEKILEIGQVYLFNEKSDRAYIKAPMDLFINSKKDITFGKFIEVDNRVHSLPYNYVLESPEDKDYIMIKNMYINIKNIYDSYFKKQSLSMEVKDEDKIFIKNYKVGIGIDKNTKKAEQGKLYKIEQTEFINNNWSYIVEYKIEKEYLRKNYKGIEFKDLDKGYLKLGGENKACKFRTINNKDVQKFNSKKEQVLTKGIYKILFTSDTYFNYDINKVFENDNVNLLGMANDKPIYVGGYDMKGKGSIRKMYKGYSAGTVLLVEIINKEENIYELFGDFNQRGFNRYIALKEEL